METTKIGTMKLPVTLTAEERAIRAGELAIAVGVRQDMESDLESMIEEHKAAKKQAESEIITAGSTVRHLAEVVRSGREDRAVEVAEQRDYAEAKVHTIRLDTGEVVGTRGMTEQERQRPLPLRSEERVEQDAAS